jgi:uncharacterized protein YkwD
MISNYVDLLLILLVLLSVVRGWQRGLLLGLIDLLRWIGSPLLALRFYQPLAHWLGPRVGWPEVWDLPVAFALALVVAAVLINILGYALARGLPQRVHQWHGNRLLGIVLGLANGIVAAAIAAALLLALPLPGGLRATARESDRANRLAAYTQRFEAAFTPVFGDAIAQTLNLLTVRPESNQRVTLPYTVAQPPPAPELEAQMLQLVNQERARAGLAPLAADPELREVARRHSADMFARGYFSHVTPEGRSPFDRMAAAGVTYRTAGENLALAPTLSLAHTGLMNSPGHRANILHPDFGRVGIGIVDGGLRGLMVTQNFRD